MKLVIGQGFFANSHPTTKRLKHSSNFESAENVRSSNVVEFKFELCHISRINATICNQLDTLHTEIYSKEYS